MCLCFVFSGFNGCNRWLMVMQTRSAFMMFRCVFSGFFLVNVKIVLDWENA